MSPKIGMSDKCYLTCLILSTLAIHHHHPILFQDRDTEPELIKASHYNYHDLNDYKDMSIFASCHDTVLILNLIFAHVEFSEIKLR